MRCGKTLLEPGSWNIAPNHTQEGAFVGRQSAHCSKEETRLQNFISMTWPQSQLALLSRFFHVNFKLKLDWNFINPFLPGGGDRCVRVFMYWTCLSDSKGLK